MVKWLSCLPSKQAARVRFPFVPFNVVPSDLPVPNATKSFWINTSGANPLAEEGSHGRLTQEADVCIIGSGISGVSAAYYLSKSELPLSVVILEAREFCSGATGRNGGHLTPNPFLGFRARQSDYGTPEAIKSYAIEQHTATSIVSFIKAHNLSEQVDLVHGGHYKLFPGPFMESAARADYEAALEADWNPAQDLEWFDAAQMNETYGAPYPAYRTSSAYNLWPLKLVTQLYTQASKSPSLNLTLHTHTPVLSINHATRPTRRWTLNTPRGRIDCTTVLHATNGYASHLLPRLSGTMIPTRGQIIAAEVTFPPTQSISLPKEGSWANGGDEYWFPRPNSTSTSRTIILGGGRKSAHQSEQNVIDDSVVNSSVGQTLRAFLPRTFSGIEMKVKVMMEWTGIMGFTTTGHPLVGQVAPGHYISVGFNGHGMPIAHGCAEAIAEMIRADLQDEEWNMPAWFPKHYLIQ
ncbi:FAD dependent oxidoreductase [Amanita rubescens]|nr:FAD dependent oxidoreductase [Amanita rubescens]